MKNILVRRLNERDGASLSALRGAAYRANQRDFVSVSDAALRWSEADSQACTLGAFDACGRLVSTMRGALFSDVVALENWSRTSFQTLRPATPALYLDRASSCDSSSGGLNTCLRAVFLRKAIQSGVLSVCGAIPAGTMRSNLLMQMDSSLRVADEHDWSHATTVRGVVVAVLCWTLQSTVHVR